MSELGKFSQYIYPKVSQSEAVNVFNTWHCVFEAKLNRIL